MKKAKKMMWDFLNDSLKTIRIMGIISGIQLISVWTCMTLVGYYHTLHWGLSFANGIVWLGYGLIPIYFSSLILTVLYKRGIIQKMF